jgi:ABC-type Na+ efflux pump permease subunit
MSMESKIKWIGLVVVLFGVIAQTYHTYHIAIMYSDLEGFNKVLQAIILSIVFSGGLVYFTIKANLNPDSNIYHKIIGWFTAFEAFINLYYWTNTIIFEPVISGNPNSTFKVVTSMMIAIPFSIAIPLVLRSYSKELNFDSKKDVSLMQAKINKLEDNVNELQNSVAHEEFIIDDHMGRRSAKITKTT